MKKITILLLSAVAIASGCKRFTDINQNQNDPTSVTPNVVLSAALAASGSSATDQFNLNEWMGYWARSGNYISVQSTEQYQLNTTYADGTWQDLYSTLSKYNYLEKTALASGPSGAFYAGVAKTMKAFHFGTLVDLFGNVPYSQAFQVNKYPTPSYDDAAAIYKNLVVQLDSAVYYFGVATTYYAHASSASINTDDQYDIMFGRAQGTAPADRMSKWIMFANTVKLRLLMNVAKNPSGIDIAGEIAKAVSSGGFLPAGLSATVNPGYGNSKSSQLMPFYGNFYTTAGNPTSVTSAFFRANTYAVNFYNATSDTYRPGLAYVPLGSGAIGSNYDGDLNAATNSFTSAIGTGLTKSATSDQIIMGDFEGLFLQSEAAARGFNVGSDAETLLKTAIEQNFVYLGDNAADADSYYSSNASNPNVDYAAAVAAVGALPASGVDKTPGLQAIMTQEWIALNGIDWFQSWTNYRRTGFPLSDVLGISHANSHVKNAIPYRYLYPQSEYDTNGKNIPALANGAYTPIFWDKLH